MTERIGLTNAFCLNFQCGIYFETIMNQCTERIGLRNVFCLNIQIFKVMKV